MSAATLVEPCGALAPSDINYHLAQAVRRIIRREDQQWGHAAIAFGLGPGLGGL